MVSPQRYSPADSPTPERKAPMRRIMLILSVSIAFIAASVGLLFAFLPFSPPATSVIARQTYLGTSLYLPTDDGMIAAYKTSDGSVRWTARSSATGGITTLLLSERVLYYTTATNVISAMNASDGAPRWRITTIPELQNYTVASELILNNGLLYMVVNSVGAMTPTSVVLAINAYNGDITWRQAITGGGRFDIAILNGVIFVGETKAPVGATLATAILHLYAFTMPTGEIRWQATQTKSLTMTLFVRSDGVYTRADHTLTAYTLNDGNRRWSQDDNVQFVGQLLVTSKNIYALVKSAAKANYLAAYATADGSRQFNRLVTQTDAIDLLLVDEEHIGLGFGPSFSVFTASDGTRGWQREDILLTPGGVKQARAIVSGVVYAATTRGLVALNATNGQQQWVAPLMSATSCSAPILDNETIVIGCNRRAFAFNAKDGSMRWQSALSATLSGTVQVGL